jgi:4-hydroxy-tetrahydrodipicolinate synthase
MKRPALADPGAIRDDPARLQGSDIMTAEAPVKDGVLAAALTPVKDDLSPDIPRWLDHNRWLLAEGCDGLAVLGTTSEANSFTVEERLALLDAMGESKIPGGRVIPGTGCCAIPDTVTLTRKAMEIGAAGVLMLPPFYYKPVSDDGLFAAYSEIIQRVGDSKLKIYLYHIPQNSGVPITFGLIEKLLKAYPDTVVGIKDSAGKFENMEGMIRNFPGFRVFSGSDKFLLDILRLGGAGDITACNNVAARLSARVLAAHRAGKVAEADALQAELNVVRETIASYPLVEALKALVARATGDDAWRRLRPPLIPLDAAMEKELTDELDAAGFTARRAA